MRISDWSSDVCSSDLGGLLERIDFAADLGRRLAECGQEAIQIADSIPADVLRDTIMRVRRKRRDLEKERIAITREPEVDEFLVALAEGRATLRLVTERVRAWLDVHGALDRFGVHHRSEERRVGDEWGRR